MSETTPNVPAPGPADNVVGRFVGVLTAPRATFAAVAARPRWIGMLALVAAMSIACVFGFLSTEVGRAALYDQQMKTVQMFIRNASPEQTRLIEDRLEQGQASARWTASAAQLVGLPLIALIVAGLLFAVFSAVLGGEASFKQVFAVVVHSSAVLAISQLFVQPLNYVLESMSNPANLGALLPFLDEASFLARLLGAINLFYLWWMVVLAIGLAVLYRRRTGPIFSGLFAVYFVLALIYAAVATAFSGA